MNSEQYQGPEYSDGTDAEGFPGGDARMGLVTAGGKYTNQELSATYGGARGGGKTHLLDGSEKAVRHLDLAYSKEVNDQLVDLVREPSTPAVVLMHLFAEQERALGGVARPARGFLPDTSVAAHGRGPWNTIVQAHQEHSRRLEACPDAQLKELVAKIGLSAPPPSLTNRKDRRTWAKIRPDRIKKDHLR